ncbi:uncharacterized protein BO97DRAFT_453235 [Aspergillus homomorphus CBS 101889]|uniref:Uncharacterized protein n=1 Tax=Aspergillus homomorphus (strain CBS 101889) TaxID=1450537 RepID=A0A395HW55_ASPHC|nr:hypothetical protein BO97DRAFT_453235 [Aspergillus homomorphus CBS 101889]RAL11756.1 hypothetical protein BO97DRAFT_453235 [Aspergillus homomorphus CBS 101889]
MFMSWGVIMWSRKPSNLGFRNAEAAEYTNEINQTSLQNETEVLKRLRDCKGIITCYRTSQYVIELARAQ